MPPRLSLLILLAVFVETAVSQTATSTSPYSSAGPYTVATTRLDILATSAAPTSTSDGGVGVPGLEGEEGEVIVYYPTVGRRRRRKQW